MAIRRARTGGQELLCELAVANDNRGGPKPVKLKLVSGPGDDAEPVITIMMPDED
jgi:hypothetical protein